eukprot:g61487.t1
MYTGRVREEEHDVMPRRKPENGLFGQAKWSPFERHGGLEKNRQGPTDHDREDEAEDGERNRRREDDWTE